MDSHPITAPHDSIGVLLVGGLVSTALYGITCLQCFIFFHRFRTERKLLKFSVWLLFLLDTAHLAVFVGYSLYWYAVINFGNIAVLDTVVWSLPAGVILTTLSDSIVRCIFIYRLWILSEKNKRLTFPLILLSLCLFGFAMALGIRSFFTHTLRDLHNTPWLLLVSFSLIVLVDFWIAITLWYFLYRAQRRVMSQTHHIVDRLISYTISTGLVTSVLSVVCTILFFKTPTNFISIGVWTLLEKLYVNALLASLNARDWYRPMGESVPDNERGERTAVEISLPASKDSEVSEHD